MNIVHNQHMQNVCAQKIHQPSIETEFENSNLSGRRNGTIYRHMLIENTHSP